MGHWWKENVFTGNDSALPTSSTKMGLVERPSQTWQWTQASAHKCNRPPRNNFFQSGKLLPRPVSVLLATASDQDSQNLTPKDFPGLYRKQKPIERTPVPIEHPSSIRNKC